MANASVFLADTFFPAASKLTGSEKGRVLEFVAAFHENPANPGVSLERIGPKGSDIWSGRISQDLRAILAKDGDAWFILYADHHNAAYRWAERRTVGRHAVTGAMQVVEVVQSQTSAPPVPTATLAPEVQRLFAQHKDDYLLSLGVPESWLPAVREVTDEDQLLQVCGALPPDVGERLLRLGSGEIVTPPLPIKPDEPLATRPEILQQYFVVDDQSDLKAALAASLERWIAFLHPSQRALVENTWKGPVKVTGSAGTGKTTVAMQRARHLARQGARVLLTTYVTTLAHNISRQLRLLCTPEELARITVSTVHARALAIAREAEPRVQPATTEDVFRVLDRTRLECAPSFEAEFVRSEWTGVVGRRALETWDEYRGAPRRGRGRPLSVVDRRALWQVFEGTLRTLRASHRYDWSALCRLARRQVEAQTTKASFDAVLVDEVQDLGPAELQFLRALAGKALGNLMLFGDAGQRIYPGGFTLNALGIDVRGRARVLRLNYRTTEQIRRAADRVLGDTAEDMDGGIESRRGTHSLLSGPAPILQGYELHETEVEEAVRRIKNWIQGGRGPGSVAVFARTSHRVQQISEALKAQNVPVDKLSDDSDSKVAVRLGTMHRAKGLEFLAVLLVDCSAGVLPNAMAIEDDDPQDREDGEDRERRLLYVAMTRARDDLAITWTGQPSPFLKPLLSAEQPKK
jgi:hypothetical protein